MDTGYASGDTSQKAKKGIENEDASKILSGAGASADENPNEKLTQGAEDISDENPSRETEETEVPSSPYQPLAYEPSSPETGPEEPSYETVFESSRKSRRAEKYRPEILRQEKSSRLTESPGITKKRGLTEMPKTAEIPEQSASRNHRGTIKSPGRPGLTTRRGTAKAPGQP